MGTTKPNYEAVVIGVSAGGLKALSIVFSAISKNFTLPIIIVQHLPVSSSDFLATHLNSLSPLDIKEADEREHIRPQKVYIAPSNYHLLVEPNRTFSLSIDPQVFYSRPSIDVLFESAANVYAEKLIGVILTGANCDGTNGLKKIKDKGGLTVVQDPTSAEAQVMPKSAIEKVNVDYILPLDQVATFLNEVA